MSKAIKLVAIYLVSALMFSLVAGKVNAEEKPVAVVNGVSIPQERLEIRVKSIVAQGQTDSPQMRDSVREELINIELISQEAVKNGVDKQTEVVGQIEFAKQSILASAYMQDFVKKNPVSEDALKQEYETIKLANSSKEYKVSHILVKEEAEAKSIAAKIKKGSKFDKLAKKHSLDPGSKEKGGELDWSRPGTFVPSFDSAMMSLKKGEVSAPVKSDYGWHIIKLDDVRDFTFPDFQEVKSDIAQRMQQQTVMKAVEDIRKSAKIE